MFEIQLTTFSDDLYNKLAHDLLYKASPGLLNPQDEMVINLSHGVARCFELCMRMLRDKLHMRGNAGTEGKASMAEDTSKLTEIMEMIGSRQAKEAQLAVDDFKRDLEILPDKEYTIQNILQLIA